MKRIGSIKGVPIVEGNANEIKNQILHKEDDRGGISLFKRKNGELKQISGNSSDSSEKDSMIRIKWLKEGEGSELECGVIQMTFELLYAANNCIRGKYIINGQPFITTFLVQGSGFDINGMKAIEFFKIVHCSSNEDLLTTSMYDITEYISLVFTNTFGMSISKEEVKAVYDKYSVSYDEFYGDIELSTTI